MEGFLLIHKHDVGYMHGLLGRNDVEHIAWTDPTHVSHDDGGGMALFYYEDAKEVEEI